MCWATSNSNNFIRNVADNDLTVYKVVKIVNGTIISYFQDYNYEFNKLYKTTLNTNIVPYNGVDLLYIDRGFHSYLVNKDLIKWMHFEPYTEIVFGTDSYVLDFFTKIIECTIPKNSIYFINEFKDVVSNKIILNRIINF